MPRFQRPRREVSPVVTKIATPLFRYSHSRDAYILRVVGDRHGPVLKPKGSGRFYRSAD
jgi:hypothetical protein